MAIRRPARKGSRSKSGPPQKAGPAKKNAEGVPGVAGQAADERKLVEAAQEDPKKFDVLYELHFERVYAFVASWVRNRTTAEDVTSEVFHKALANLTSYEWRGVPFVAWLLRIAANAIVDQAKRAAREFPSPDDPPEIPAEPDLQASELRAVEHRAQLFRLVDNFQRFRNKWCTADLWNSVASGRSRNASVSQRERSSNCSCARYRI